MDIKKFAKEYEEKNILEIYPLIKDIFQEKLSKEFLEEFDPVDIIIDLFDACKKFKQFEKEIEITKIIKEHNPKVYHEAQQYIDDDLIDYYLYHNQKENLEEPVNSFISNPVETIDYFLLVLKKLVFYQHIDLVDRMIVKCFNKIFKAPGLIGGATNDLRMAKFELSLEKSLDKNNKINISEMQKEIDNYDMKLLEKDAELFSLILSDFTEKELIEKFVKDKSQCLNTIGVFFRKYLKSKNICFPLSAIFYCNVFEFWLSHSNKKENNPNKYFFMKKDKFDTFLAKMSGGMFSNNFAEVFSTLWGSYYVYDFLKSINFIDENVHKSSIEAISTLKNELIETMKYSLWQYAFVVQWSKPDGMTDEIYNKEKDVFKESYFLIPSEEKKKKDLFSLYNNDFSEIEELFKNNPKKSKPKKK